MILNDSGVVFNEVEHTYTLNGKELHGITGFIRDIIFPEKYKFVKPEVLEAAAKRGSEIHKGLEMINIGFNPAEYRPEYRSYRRIIETFDLNPLCGEYTVTDGDFFATNIDCVYTRKDEIIIVDYKTTSKLDIDYLTWQLSVCAYLFELQNPHLKVNVIAGMWLKHEYSDYVVLQRKSDEEVEEFLSAAKSGQLFCANKEALQLLYDVEAEIIAIEEEQKKAAQRKSELQDTLRKAMEKSGTVLLRTERLTISYRRAHKTAKFDAKSFKEENERLYNQYVKEVEVKPTVLIKYK